MQPPRRGAGPSGCCRNAPQPAPTRAKAGAEPPGLGVTPRLCFAARTTSEVPNYGKSAEKAALAHRTDVLGVQPTVPKQIPGDATLPQRIPRTAGHVPGAQRWKCGWGSAAGGSGALVSPAMAGERAGRGGWQKPRRGGSLQGEPGLRSAVPEGRRGLGREGASFPEPAPAGELITFPSHC